MVHDTITDEAKIYKHILGSNFKEILKYHNRLQLDYGL